MRSVLLSALALSSFALAAQQPAAAPAAPAAPAKMEAPKPGPEMAKLQDLIGNFRVDEHIEASAMGPASVGAGFSHVAQGPGGFSILIDYTTLSGAMHGLKGHGAMAWDDNAKTYKQSWVDSMSPTLTVSTGAWEGDTLVMHSEGSFMGKPYKEQDVFSGIGADGFTITISWSMDGGPMTKMMTLNHHRLASAAAPATK
ncbi:MAG: DUF1579 family protein [Acidobacteria bacterium]|nr:DUF1579 family protein [Acidobacteriota bacterium]